MDLTGLSILIVEDEPLLRKQLAAKIEKLGADVTTAESLAPARNLAKDLAFDFALLDMNLPDGFGIELLKERAFPEHTAVIIMTAQAKIADAVEAIRAGAVEIPGQAVRTGGVVAGDFPGAPIQADRSREGKES